MIPVKDTLVDIDNLPGEEIEFGIGDPRWVMKTQADLYSDISTAIIREYSTNAYDANVMAGHSRPIRVTLPSMMNNNMFVVEDDGVGMSLDLLKKVYTQFGVSDKRESQTTNGMLGYGSKSGVAYTTRFKVTTVRDGIKIVGVISRKPDWRIVLKVVAHAKTDEANGTRIEIPVHNPDEFVHKANEFYKFWLPGRVLVNGKEPRHEVGEKIADNLYYCDEWNTSYIVMGNVPYRINNPSALFQNSKMRDINFVAYVDSVTDVLGGEVAAVEFTPSREDLKYTDHTKATLQKVIHDFERDILAIANAEVAAAATHSDAFKSWSKWVDVLGREMFSELEYNGDKLEPEFKILAQRYYTNGYGWNTVQGIVQWQVEQMERTMVVTEFDIQMSSNAKSKAKEYAKLNGWPSTYILFTKQNASEIKSAWISKEHFVSWEDLKAALPKKTRPAGGGGTSRIPGTFDYYTRDGLFVERSLPTKGTIFYVTASDRKTYSVDSILTAMDSDAFVVVLTANRIKKFNRDYPHIKEFLSYARAQVVKDGPSLLSEEAKMAMRCEYSSRRILNQMDVEKVADPEIKTLIESIKGDDAAQQKEYRANLELARLVGNWYNVKRYEPKSEHNIFTKYPLLSAVQSHRPNLEHAYLYIAAVYAAETENNDG